MNALLNNIYMQLLMLESEQARATDVRRTASYLSSYCEFQQLLMNQGKWSEYKTWAESRRLSDEDFVQEAYNHFLHGFQVLGTYIEVQAILCDDHMIVVIPRDKSKHVYYSPCSKKDCSALSAERLFERAVRFWS